MQRKDANHHFRKIAAPMLRRGLGRIKLADQETGWRIALLDKPKLTAFVSIPERELVRMDETDVTREINSQCRAIIKEVNAREDEFDDKPPRRF